MSDADPPTVGAAESEDGAEAAGVTNWPLLGVAFAVLWLFVRGVTVFAGGELELGPVLGEFIIGLAVGLPIAYLFRRFYSPRYVVSRTPRAVPAAAKYLTVFLWELVTANVDVARRVLSPSMPIEPAVIEVPLRVETDLAITTIANSITLTPGTLTMDYDAERNALYVHAIAGSDPEAVVDPIRAWEDYALVVFDEEREPGSPVPDPEGPPEEPRTEATADGGDGDE